MIRKLPSRRAKLANKIYPSCSAARNRARRASLIIRDRYLFRSLLQDWIARGGMRTSLAAKGMKWRAGCCFVFLIHGSWVFSLAVFDSELLLHNFHIKRFSAWVESPFVCCTRSFAWYTGQINAARDRGLNKEHTSLCYFWPPQSKYYCSAPAQLPPLLQKETLPLDTYSPLLLLRSSPEKQWRTTASHAQINRYIYVCQRNEENGADEWILRLFSSCRKANLLLMFILVMIS